MPNLSSKMEHNLRAEEMNERYMAALPEYEHAPLREVAISVQFAPLSNLSIPMYGLLWQHYSGRFPHIEEHPPLDPQIERFGVIGKPKAPRVEFMTRPPLPRVWFVDDTRRELIQIQHDRFIRNWRKVDDDDKYPRYEPNLRPKFLEDYQDFVNFVESNKIGSVVPNQCEVNYVNIIPRNSEWETHADIDKVFSVVSNEYRSHSELDVEDMRFQIRHFLLDDNGQKIGRLHVEIAPATLISTDECVFEMKLTARGHPGGPKVSDVMSFVDNARKAIVMTFDKAIRQSLYHSLGRK